MIYHITEKSEWLLAKAAGKLEPESLQIEGFIHCCTEQLFSQIANFYFKGLPVIVVLEIEEDRLTAELKWEVSRGHRFPHIYGPLDTHAVVREAEVVPNAEGLFEFPFQQLLH